MLNGNWEGDQDGEFTYIGKQGQSVIDYGVVNFQVGQNIEYFRIEERTESDHLPMALELRVQREEPMDRRKVRKKRTDWTADGIKKKNTKGISGQWEKKLYESTNYDEFAKAVQSAQKVVTTKGRSNG